MEKYTSSFESDDIAVQSSLLPSRLIWGGRRRADVGLQELLTYLAIMPTTSSSFGPLVVNSRTVVVIVGFCMPKKRNAASFFRNLGEKEKGRGLIGDNVNLGGIKLHAIACSLHFLGGYCLLSMAPSICLLSRAS